MGKKGVTCFFERAAANQVVIKGLAIRGPFFSVIISKIVNFRGDKIASTFHCFQDQGRAQLRDRVYLFSVKAFIHHEFQSFSGCATECGKIEQVFQWLGYDDFQLKFFCESGEDAHNIFLAQKQKGIIFIQEGMRVRKVQLNFFLQMTIAEIVNAIGCEIHKGKGKGVKICKISTGSLKTEVGFGREAAIQ